MKKVLEIRYEEVGNKRNLSSNDQFLIEYHEKISPFQFVLKSYIHLYFPNIMDDMDISVLKCR